MEVIELIPFVAVCAAAVTALSTLAGIRLANRASESQLKLRLSHEDAKDRREAIRVRLEELYQLIGQWAGEVVGHHITYRSVMLGQLTYNQALDLTIKHGSPINSERLFTLAELYFPECHVVLSKIKSARDKAAKVQSAFKEQHRDSGEGSREHATALSKALEEFNAAIASYKKALAVYAREV